ANAAPTTSPTAAAIWRSRSSFSTQSRPNSTSSTNPNPRSRSARSLTCSVSRNSGLSFTSMEAGSGLRSSSCNTSRNSTSSARARASIEVKLKPKFRDAEHVNDVADRLRGFGFVDDVRFGRDWVEKLDRLRQIAAAVGLVVGAAFAVVAIIIIGTTIRMAVLQRGREIAIMRLVGATNGFIRRPFLLQGAIKGMLGGLVAVGLSYGAYTLINRWLIQAAFFSNVQALAIVGFGTLIGLFGSAASVGRHLRRV